MNKFMYVMLSEVLKIHNLQFDNDTTYELRKGKLIMHCSEGEITIANTKEIDSFEILEDGILLNIESGNFHLNKYGAEM